MDKVLAVIIPMYNEEQNVVRCIDEMLKVIDSMPSVRLFIVNDGSSDRTSDKIFELLSRMEKKSSSESISYNFTFCDLKKNCGYGLACLEGAKSAASDGYIYGLFMDSDLTNDPGLIKFFFKIIKENDFDLIKASRYISGGGMEGVPLYRQLITIVGNKIASISFGVGIKDCTNGFRAVRLKMIVNQKFHESGFPIILEELYLLKKIGAKMTEIPYVLTSRQSNEGLSKFSYSFKIIFSYLKYALMALFVSYKRRS